MRPIVIATVLLAVLVPSLPAQNDDEADVLAVIERLFDGMRQRDTTSIGQLVDPEARLVVTGTREGTPYARAVPISEFMAAVAQAEGDPWIERIYHPKVHVSDHLATVWTWYVFHVGERLSHCGVDSFQLARGTEGWKIISIADTRRTDGCEEVATREPDR